jgi:hypothetical protein
MITDPFRVAKKSLDGRVLPNFSNPKLSIKVRYFTIFAEPVHYEKKRIKPPIPRMTSKTPTKNN